MFFTSILAATAAIFSTASAAPTETDPISVDPFSLEIDTSLFNTSNILTAQVSYANSSAWVGQIKYQIYSEPLLVVGAGVGGRGDGLYFESIHAVETGGQIGYIMPEETEPLHFAPPHGSPPAGAMMAGFTFSDDGALMNNGMNLFYACQDAEQAAISSYEIWWFGAGEPSEVECKGPLTIKHVDGCGR